MVLVMVVVKVSYKKESKDGGQSCGGSSGKTGSVKMKVVRGNKILVGMMLNVEMEGGRGTGNRDKNGELKKILFTASGSKANFPLE